MSDYNDTPRNPDAPAHNRGCHNRVATVVTVFALLWWLLNRSAQAKGPVVQDPGAAQTWGTAGCMGKMTAVVVGAVIMVFRPWRVRRV